jgi:hypothetical protein
MILVIFTMPVIIIGVFVSPLPRKIAVNEKDKNIKGIPKATILK